MSDDLKKKGPPDSNLISTKEPWELQYWTTKFGVTPQQLKDAIKDAGSNSADKVEKQIKKKQ